MKPIRFFTLATMRINLFAALLLSLLIPRVLQAEAIRDEGNFFSPDAKKSLLAKIGQLAAQTNPTQRIFIVTKDKVEGNLATEVQKAAPPSSENGVYIFISRDPKKLLLIASKSTHQQVPKQRLKAIRSTILADFASGNFARGLETGIDQLAQALTAPHSPEGGLLAHAEQAAKVSNGEMDSNLLQRILVLVAVILGVLGLLRLLANVLRPRYPHPGNFGNNQAPGGFPQGGGPYGGGGGSIWQSMFGGIAGAMAGNWMYDKFFGHGQAHGSNFDHLGGPAVPPSPPPSGGPSDGGWDYHHSAGDFSSGDDWGGGNDSSSGDDW